MASYCAPYFVLDMDDVTDRDFDIDGVLEMVRLTERVLETVRLTEGVLEMVRLTEDVTDTAQHFQTTQEDGRSLTTAGQACQASALVLHVV
jgi:hypothetical protein